MPRRITDRSGVVWEVMPSGRRTQYGADETSLEFRRTDDDAIARRFCRFSPRGAKSAEIALEDASDASLVTLLDVSQPAWSSPDGAYGRAL